MEKKEDLVENIEDLEIKSQFWTFLIDKWHGISSSNAIAGVNSNEYHLNFYDAFHIPYKYIEGRRDPLRLLNPITGKYVSKDIFFENRYVREFGCMHGQKKRIECELENCEYRLKELCNLSTPNIWYRDDLNTIFFLTDDYLDVIYEYLLNKQKIPITIFSSLLFPDLSGSAAIKNFIQQFNFNSLELETLFSLPITNVNSLESDPSAEIIDNSGEEKEIFNPLDNPRTEILNQIKQFKINPAFLLFLIDKWRGISPTDPIQSHWALDDIIEFYNTFGLMYEKKDEISLNAGRQYRFLQIFTGNMARLDSIFWYRQSSNFGCVRGQKKRSTCVSKICDQITTKAESHQCDQSKPNIWVQDGDRNPYFLSDEYITAIANLLLHQKKVPLDLISNFFFPQYDVPEAIIQFCAEFKINSNELDEFFQVPQSFEEKKREIIPKRSNKKNIIKNVQQVNPSKDNRGETEMVEEVEEAQYDKIKIGKRLLEAFTSELYDNVECVTREYISNAIDARATNIDILIDKDKQSVIIFDNGNGMDEEEINRCMDIMVSPKDGMKFDTDFPPIGEIGIGVYSAGKICENIKIISKKSGEEVWHFRRIPIGQWMRDLTDKSKTYLHDVTISYQKEIPVNDSTEITESATRIILQDIIESKFKEFLPDEENSSYDFYRKLCQIVPVDFGDKDFNVVNYINKIDTQGTLQIKKNINAILNGEKFGKIRINDEIEIPLNYNHCNIILSIQENGNQESLPVRRSVPEDEILSPKFFFETKSFFDNNGLFIGAGWAVFRGPKMRIAAPQFSDSLYRGLTVRLYNVLINGPQEVWDWARSDDRSLKSYPLDNIWGEIYLYSPHLHPKSSRDTIKLTPYWKFIKNEIAVWLNSLANKGEIQRKKSQTAKRLTKLYSNGIQRIILENAEIFETLSEYKQYNSNLSKFFADPTSTEYLDGLINSLAHLVVDFSDMCKELQNKLIDVQGEPNQASNSFTIDEMKVNSIALNQLDSILQDIQGNCDEFLNKGYIADSSSECLHSLMKNIEDIHEAIQDIYNEQSKIEEEKRKRAEEEKIVEEQRKQRELDRIQEEFKRREQEEQQRKFVEERAKKAEQKKQMEEKKKIAAQKRIAEAERKKAEEERKLAEAERIRIEKELEEAKETTRQLAEQKAQMELARKEIEEQTRALKRKKKENLATLQNERSEDENSTDTDEKFEEFQSYMQQYKAKKKNVIFTIEELKPIMEDLNFVPGDWFPNFAINLGNSIVQNTTISREDYLEYLRLALDLEEN